MWMFYCRACGELIGPDTHIPVPTGYVHSFCEEGYQCRT
jgi:hypothetical protein